MLSAARVAAPGKGCETGGYRASELGYLSLTGEFSK